MPVRPTLQGVGGNPTWGKRNPDEDSFLTQPYVYRDSILAADSESIPYSSNFAAIPVFQLSGERIGRHTLIVSVLALEDTPVTSTIPAATPVIDTYGLLLRDMTDSDPLNTGADISALGASFNNNWLSGNNGNLLVPVSWMLIATLAFGVDSVVRSNTLVNIPAGDYKIAILGNGNSASPADIPHPISLILQHTE